MKLRLFKISLVLFLFYSMQLNAQSKESYCEKWEKVRDTLKTYNTIFKHNYNMLPKVDSKCKAGIFVSNGILYREQQKIDSALVNFNKAINIGEQFNLTNELIKAYAYKGYTYAQTSKLDEAKTLLKKAKILLDKAPDNKDWNLYFQTQAYLADINSEYHDAIAYTDSSIVFSEKIDADLFVQTGYTNKGTYLMRISDYEAAAESYLKTIELTEKTGRANSIEVSYHLLANCYRRMEQHETAIKYFEKALEYSVKANNNYVTMLTYSRMAPSQIALKRIDEALVSIDSSIAKAIRINDYATIGKSYNDKAAIYLNHLEDEDKAEYYFNKSYENSLKANTSKKSDDLLKTTALQGMVIINLKKKKFIKAKGFLKELEREADKSGLLLYKKRVNELYSKYYEAIGQPSKAIKYLREEYKIKDSISNDKVKTQVAKLEKQYNTASKELEIVKLNEQKLEQQQIATQAKAKQTLYLITAILLLSLLIFGYWLFRKLKKQKEELDATNKVKNKLFSIIAHDIRGMIIPFQRSGRMLQYYIEEENYDKTITFSQELQKNSNGLSTMLDNLLSWSIEQMNGYKMNPELLYVSEEIKEIKSNFSQQAEFKNTKINIVNEEEIALKIDKGAFHIIFRNLIGNALKYTEKGMIRIELKRALDKLHFMITDTGLGMSKEQVDNLFTIDTNESSVGTKGEKGTGLGLGLVYRFVTMNGGKIKVSSEKRVGTKFELSFPLTENDILETDRVNRKEQSA